MGRPAGVDRVLARLGDGERPGDAVRGGIDGHPLHRIGNDNPIGLVGEFHPMAGDEIEAAEQYPLAGALLLVDGDRGGPAGVVHGVAGVAGAVGVRRPAGIDPVGARGGQRGRPGGGVGRRAIGDQLDGVGNHIAVGVIAQADGGRAGREGVAAEQLPVTPALLLVDHHRGGAGGVLDAVGGVGRPVRKGPSGR